MYVCIIAYNMEDAYTSIGDEDSFSKDVQSNLYSIDTNMMFVDRTTENDGRNTAQIYDSKNNVRDGVMLVETHPDDSTMKISLANLKKAHSSQVLIFTTRPPSCFLSNTIAVCEHIYNGIKAVLCHIHVEKWRISRKIHIYDSSNSRRVCTARKIREKELPYGEIRHEGRDMKTIIEVAETEPLILQIDAMGGSKNQVRETYFCVFMGDFKQTDATYSIYCSQSVQYDRYIHLCVFAFILYSKNIYCV